VCIEDDLSEDAVSQRGEALSHIPNYIELIKFDVGDRAFCADVDQVLGLVTVNPQLAHIPQCVPFNNEQIPVYSLDRLLDMEEKDPFPKREILVLHGQQRKFGIAVDWVGEIYRVPTSRAIFRFPESRGARIKMFGIWGIAALGGGMALIIEPESLVMNEQLDTEPILSPSPNAYRIQTTQL